MKKKKTTGKTAEATVRKSLRASSSGESSAARAHFAPKSIAIMYRPGTPDAIRQANQLSKFLTEEGYAVFCTPGQKLAAKCELVTPANLGRIDWVIALGGDGTYLRAVRMLEGRQTPILGVNMGGLGFLTETRVEDLYKAIADTLAGNMEMRPRAMLKIEVRRNGKLRSSNLALNDAVLERGSNTHLINIEIFSQKHLVANIKADALVIASPTGSTAYNLAAGGPICHPEVRAIVVTPVCPHALTSRPLIFPDDQKLSFKVKTRDKDAILTVDGMISGQITIEDEVTIVRNEVDHFVIRKPSSNYFNLLREKLSFGQRD